MSPAKIIYKASIQQPGQPSPINEAQTAVLLKLIRADHTRHRRRRRIRSWLNGTGKMPPEMR